MSEDNSSSLENVDDEEYSEIDEDRPTLIQINRKISKMQK